jgi:hypothetical protein
MTIIYILLLKNKGENMKTEKEINIQTAYDHLKNHQNLKDFDLKIDEYGNLEINDKRTLEPDYKDTYRDYSLFISTKKKYCLHFISQMGYRDEFDSDDANKLHSKNIEFRIYKNMIYLTFDVQDETNLEQLVEYIKFMADYLLDFD